MSVRLGLIGVVSNEFCRIEPAPRVLAVTRADERREELAHFKMEMGKITAVAVPTVAICCPCFTRSPDGRACLAHARNMTAHIFVHRF